MSLSVLILQAHLKIQAHKPVGLSFASKQSAQISAVTHAQPLCAGS